MECLHNIHIIGLKCENVIGFDNLLDLSVKMHTKVKNG